MFHNKFPVWGLLAVMTASLLTASNVSAQKGTIVVNTAENPVRVKAVDNPALGRYQVGLSLGQIANVPDGKIFVIEHISGSLMIELNAGATGPCRIHYLAFGTGNVSIDVVPTYMASAKVISSEFSFFSFSQSVKAYVGPNSDFGGVTSGLSSHCKSVEHSRIAFTGYLVDIAN